MNSLLNSNSKTVKWINKVRSQISVQNNVKARAIFMEIQKPFYIDRYHQYEHNNCHIEGICQGCEHRKTMMASRSQNHKFLKSNKGRVRLKTEKEAGFEGKKQNRERKYRASQGQESDNFEELIKILVEKDIRCLGQDYKEKLKKRTGKVYRNDKILEQCLDFLQVRFKGKGYNWSKNDYKMLLLETRKMNLKQILQSNQFIKFLQSKQKNQQKGIQRKEVKYLPDIVRQVHKNVVHIPVIQRLKKTAIRVNNTFKSGNNKPRKQFKSEQLNEVNPRVDEPICNKILTHIENVNLSIEVAEILKEIIQRNFKNFRQVIHNLEGEMEKKMEESAHNHDLIYLRIENAANFMRKSIPQNGQSVLKQKEISKLLKKVTDSKRNSRKSSLKNNNKIQEAPTGKAEKSIFFIDNDQTENEDDWTEQQFNKTRKSLKNRRKSMLKKDKDSENSHQENFSGQNQMAQLQDYRAIQQKRASQRTKQGQLSNSDKLIQQQEGDILKIMHEKLQRKQQTGTKGDKLSFAKVVRSKMQESGQKKKAEEVRVEKKDGKNSIRFQNINNPKDFKQIIKKGHSFCKKQSSYNQNSFVFVKSQKQADKKRFLQIKAAQFLKQNQALIKKVQKILLTLGLQAYIINPKDCAFNQKKKIRILKQSVNVWTEGKEMPEKIISLVISYLRVYSENYQILMGTYRKDKEEGSQGEQEASKAITDPLLKKGQELECLIFYDLKKNSQEGRQEQINFTTGFRIFETLYKRKTEKRDQEQIKKVNEKKKKENEERMKEQQGLIQKQVSERCLEQSFGIARMLAESRIDK